MCLLVGSGWGIINSTVTHISALESLSDKNPNRGPMTQLLLTLCAAAAASCR